MEAFYFADDKRLYGAFSPAEGASRRHAVLVCNPLAHEAYKAHFVLRRLVEQLTDAGFDVLRFDYSGSGDSWGDLADVPQLKLDINDALVELRELASADTISVVAPRFAAALVVGQDLANLTPGDHLVLWDPILDGDRYADDLRQAHLSLVAKHTRASRDARDSAMSGELLGMANSDRFLDSLRSESGALSESVPVSCVLSANQSLPSALSNADVINVESTCPWIDPDLRLMYNADVVRALETVLCR